MDNGANTRPVRVDLEPGHGFVTQAEAHDFAIGNHGIEKKPYRKSLAETVLAPLKMNNSTYSQRYQRLA